MSTRQRRHTPVHTTAAHDDVTGSEPVAQLRGHRQQTDSGGPARRVHTGSDAFGSDKRGDQPVELV